MENGGVLLCTELNPKGLHLRVLPEEPSIPLDCSIHPTVSSL